ncbi:MAG: (2Fe-2S)-binding protein [Anaerolineales bacterium]|nr:(2Fe-2S)-binding protein [Anaerolineales bacterium]
MINITLTINGIVRTLAVLPEERLLDVLRDRLGLMGTKEGCGSGDCGACTVLMNGRPVTSCMVLAATVDQADILTIEGLEQDGKLHPLQQAFIDEGAVQCGFCTPGMILSSLALLQENPDPDEEAIKRAIAGNLCRCTGYARIFAAIKTAALRMRSDA